MTVTRQRRTNTPVSMAAIRRYARQIAAKFHPEKVILFGSYAYGEPHADSDVDLLVVMPTRDQVAQSVRICLAVSAPFPLDLIVRTPRKLQQRLALGDSFMREIVTQGKVLHEESDTRMGEICRGRLDRGRGTRSAR